MNKELDLADPKALKKSIDELVPEEDTTEEGEKFTKRETYFLKILFDEAEGDVAKAKHLAGYASTGGRLPKNLKEEIVKRAENLLALNAPKAAMVLVGELSDKEDQAPNTKQAKFRVAVAEKVLDRVGISRKQQVEVQGEIQHNVFLLPEKRPTVIDVNATTVEPETEEND